MSPRPKKARRCCPTRRPDDQVYKPAGTPMSQLEIVKIAADELEAAGLCDVEGMTQAEAGEAMGVSRGTIQRLVTSGREKIIAAIIAGKALEIELHEQE